MKQMNAKKKRNGELNGRVTEIRSGGGGSAIKMKYGMKAVVG
jgi:hypothetical protein